MTENVRYDEDGDLITDGLTPMQLKYFDMRPFFSDVGEKVFIKAFMRCWDKSPDFDGNDMDAELEEHRNHESTRKLMDGARFNQR